MRILISVGDGPYDPAPISRSEACYVAKLVRPPGSAGTAAINSPIGRTKAQTGQLCQAASRRCVAQYGFG